jgi:hypothetical protein
MRHLFIILLLTFGLFEKVFSDAGNCVKYDVDIQLIDGQKIRGFVFAGGFEKRFQFKDISFLDYLKKNNPTDTLHVFKNIRPLKFPTTNWGREKCEFHFDAATTNNIIKISKKKIKIIKVVSYTICNNCDIADEENGYNWNGLYPTVITELTGEEIDLLQTVPVTSLSFLLDENIYESYWITSYNEDYKTEKLIELFKSFQTSAAKLFKDNKADKVQSVYNTFKATLRAKRVIVFKTGAID